MEYLSDRMKFDTDVYDELPDKDPENYIQGFCSFLYVPNSIASINHIESNLDDSNAIAIIPTEYATSDEKDVPYTVAYVLHESIVERTVFLLTNNAQRCLFIKPFSDKPVFFHKGWTREGYVPGLFDDAKKHKILMKAHRMRQYVPKEEMYRIFRQYDLSRECYTKKDDGTDMCSMSKQRSRMACSRCFLSDLFGKYCSVRSDLV